MIIHGQLLYSTDIMVQCTVYCYDNTWSIIVQSGTVLTLLCTVYIIAMIIWYICWLPNPHFCITGNNFCDTGNATRTGMIYFFSNITGKSAAKLGLPYPNTYNTSNVIFLVTLLVQRHVITGRSTFFGYHTGTGVECLDYSTGNMFFCLQYR
jgi:hypothetical protein